MTTRDSRSRPPGAPDPGGVRERTQSLQIELDDAERDSHPSLDVGTSDSPRSKIESPRGRNKTPPPRDPRPGAKPPPVPDRLGEDPEARIGVVDLDLQRLRPFPYADRIG